MKKLIAALALAFVLAPIRPAFADSAITTPIAGSDQLVLSLLNHVVGVTEFTTRGTTKIEFIDGLVQFGHYKKDYILAADGGFCNSTVPDTSGHLATTWGIHAHVFSFLNSVLDINPALADSLSLLELTPRWSYDTDVHHGVLGFTFGARIPF